MRPLVPVVVLLLLTPFAAALPPTLRLPDGITALIAPADSVAEEVFTRDANGDLVVEVRIFEKRDGLWQQVRMGAALRMAVYDLEGEHDVFTQGFLSSATAPVRLVVPGELVASGQVFDLWVTMARPDGTFPTSHHSVQKNVLLREGQHDLADVFDYHHGLNPIAA